MSKCLNIRWHTLARAAAISWADTRGVSEHIRALDTTQGGSLSNQTFEGDLSFPPVHFHFLPSLHMPSSSTNYNNQFSGTLTAFPPQFNELCHIFFIEEPCPGFQTRQYLLIYPRCTNWKIWSRKDLLPKICKSAFSFGNFFWVIFWTNTLGFTCRIVEDSLPLSKIWYSMHLWCLVTSIVHIHTLYYI